jgi:CDP-diacylglycerol--serine O-phosphatidyltransferase
MTNSSNNKIKGKKGIYLLPNLFTTFGIFFGFYGIISSMSGNYSDAGFAIFVAMLMDSFDGRVARMTNTTSAFGAEYDSLADMVSFGVAPALIAYNWGALEQLGKFGWLAVFVYVVCGALRLARFNVMPETIDKKYFQGLPIPAAAGVVVGLVWFGEKMHLDGSSYSMLVALVTVGCGLLMVSNFRYHSFKEVDWKGKVPFVSLLLMVLIVVMVAINPPLVLFPAFSIYLISGPIVTFMQLQKIRSQRKKESKEEQ